MTTPAGFLRALVASAVLAIAFAAAAAAQGDTVAQAAIRAALTQWMADFNAGKADKLCDLFASDVVAQYRGQPERDYDALCDLLKRSLSDHNKSYRYALAIKEILVEGDLAVVPHLDADGAREGRCRRDHRGRARHGRVPPPERRHMEDFPLSRL